MLPKQKFLEKLKCFINSAGSHCFSIDSLSQFERVVGGGQVTNRLLTKNQTVTKGVGLIAQPISNCGKLG